MKLNDREYQDQNNMAMLTMTLMMIKMVRKEDVLGAEYPLFLSFSVMALTRRLRNVIKIN